MTDFSQFVPAYIRRLARGDRPLKQSSGNAKPIALNLNENPFGPSPLAVQAIEAALSNINRYPEIQATELHEAIAQFHGVQPDQVLVTAGATELLCILAKALLAPRLSAITSARSFIVYKLATQVTEGNLIEVVTRDNGYDLNAIADAIDANTRIVFIANPNNPTGTLVTADEVEAFLESVPDHVLVVLDEAYGDFAEDFARTRGLVYSRSLDYIRQDRNVVLLKTFSKTHGLAGLRVGYGIGTARLMSLFAPLRTIFSVSSIAQVAALAALHDREHILKAVENNAVQSEILAAGLQGQGFAVPQTWANFLYCELGQDAAEFAERLRRAGVIVQPLGMWGAPTAVRISIGTAEENRGFLEALGEVLSDSASAVPRDNDL
jgi:histidinol-phosphate aminotransferase